MPRQTVPFTIGRGLDRASGLVASQPQYPTDARNVFARDGKMSLAPGLAGSGFPPLAWGTDILAEFGVKATHDVMKVVYDRDSREIRIFRLNTDDALLQTIASPPDGLWGTLNVDASFPVVSVAESAGLVFFAHDEPVIDFRLPMVYYTPDSVNPSTVGTLTTYMADLVGDDVSVPHPVYPTGVFAYLEYLAFWGYGTFDDPDRGDIMHLSMPSAPLDARPPNYAIFGVPKDPIVGVVTVGDVEGGTGILAVGKSEQTFRLVGSNFDTFRPQLHDDKHGFVSSRVAINIGTRAFTYSSDGPREVTLTGTAPIGQALELISPQPADLPLAGPGRLAFAGYDIARYLVVFVFPDLEAASVPVLGYLLSLWNPADPRWTYREFQQPVSCVGTLYSRDAGALPDPPVGYASDLAAVDL